MINHLHSPCCCMMTRTFQIPVGLSKSTAKNELFLCSVKLRVYIFLSTALGAGLSLYTELCQHVLWSAILPWATSENNPTSPATKYITNSSTQNYSHMWLFSGYLYHIRPNEGFFHIPLVYFTSIKIIMWLSLYQYSYFEEYEIFI